MTRLVTDSVIAMRQLARSWRIVLVVGLTIALAVAATATTLTVLNAVLLRPLPFPQADRLYRVLPFNARGEPSWVSMATLVDWQDRLRGVRLAGLTIHDFNVLGDKHRSRFSLRVSRRSSSTRSAYGRRSAARSRTTSIGRAGIARSSSATTSGRAGTEAIARSSAAEFVSWVRSS